MLPLIPSRCEVVGLFRFENACFTWFVSLYSTVFKFFYQVCCNLFADLFTIRRVELESLEVKGESFIVYCLDASVFVHRIAMRRGMTSDHFRVKFDVDYGQSFLKVTLTLTDASLHCSVKPTKHTQT